MRDVAARVSIAASGNDGWLNVHESPARVCGGSPPHEPVVVLVRNVERIPNLWLEFPNRYGPFTASCQPRRRERSLHRQATLACYVTNVFFSLNDKYGQGEDSQLHSQQRS